MKEVVVQSWSHLFLCGRRVWYGDVQGGMERGHVCDTEGVILKNTQDKVRRPEME